MTAPLIRLDRLSPAELAAARLDGDAFELGGGYMPADAAETAPLRAATLAGTDRDGFVAVGLSAAWVHGAAREEPLPHLAQPRPGVRARGRGPVPGLRVRDRAVEAEDAVSIGGLWVLTPARTLGDLALAIAARGSASRGQRITSRADRGALAEAFEALAREPAHIAGAIAWLEAHTMTNKRGALRALRGVSPM